jgi:hypothetical protein
MATSREQPAEVGAGLAGERTIIGLVMTAKEKLLERAPDFTEAEATAALRVIEAQTELARYFEEEAKLSGDEVDAREKVWAEANAHEAIREEPW